MRFANFFHNLKRGRGEQQEEHFEGYQERSAEMEIRFPDENKRRFHFLQL